MAMPYNEMAYQDGVIFEKTGINGHVANLSDFFNEETKIKQGYMLAAAPIMLQALELVNEHYGEDSDVFYFVRGAIEEAKKGFKNDQ